MNDFFSRYANRAKNIKNQPRINEDPKDALLRKFQEEIARLKGQLEGKGKSGRKSRRHRNQDGIEIEDDDENGDQDDEELYLKEQKDKLNEEKRTIMQKKNMNGKIRNFSSRPNRMGRLTDSRPPTVESEGF